MYAEERLQLIVARARAQGRIDVTTLAAELDVTPETVRRDLTSLERQGLLRRVHGGAIPVERLGFEPAVGQRAEHNQEEKDRIAKAAIAELPVEGAILLDSGTTTARIAELLPLDCELTVVTNSLPIALTLSVRPNLQVLVTGGRVRSRTLAAVGDWAGDALASVRVDVAFLGANGVSATYGVTTPDQAEAAAKRAMIRAARRPIVVADHSKLGADYFARFGELAEIDTLITDTGADDDIVAELESGGLRVVRA
jgi:DeoR family transcriptional regulator, fructose operon transcriptional repressor